MTAIPSPAAARLFIVIAALLWSTSGAFTNVLRQPTALGLNDPPLHPLQIATGRGLFAGLVMLPLLRRRDVTFRPGMVAVALTFAAMNALFIAALALGSSANAILLQYTAPLWLFLASLVGLGARGDHRGTGTVLIGTFGIALIVYGGWVGEELGVILLGLGSGVTYAGVILGLGLLRDVSPVWLTIVNHLFAAAVLAPFVLTMPPPTVGQVAWLVLFGCLQMGTPYLLMARSLRSISPQEAATLSLLEPVLNPVWAYLVAPAKEAPTVYTVAGGLCILGALAYRYWPRGVRSVTPDRAPSPS
ncbi:MAG: DMT family transporter [Gemmataceae bacterium]